MSNRTHPTLGEYIERVSKHSRRFGGYRNGKNAVRDADIPLISVITVTYNADKTLHRTLESVKAQTYKNIEHIIIDGGSTDGTLQIIQSSEDAIAYWCSEPDNGIYDAFNKGIALATGEFIGVLNADDYYESDQLENAVAALKSSDAPFVHGDIILHGWQGQDIVMFGDPHYELKIREGMPSLHQVTTLCRRSVFQDFGLFSTRYRIAGDFDWYLRLANQNCVGAYAPNVRAHMTAGGVSTTQQRRANFEAFIITWRHGLGFTRALRVTLPRIAFPNGTPHLLNRFGKVFRNPLLIFSRLLACMVPGNRGVGSREVAPAILPPFLQAFIAARQLTLSLNSLGLEWIYGVGLRSRTYMNYSTTSGASAAELLLTAAGSVCSNNMEAADVVIMDEEQVNIARFGAILERKTVLLALGNDGAEPRNFPFSFLNLGGFVGCGVLINPALSLR